MKIDEVVNAPPPVGIGGRYAANVKNTGELGKLEAALNLWGEGKVSEAQPYLLALEAIARPFRLPTTAYRVLYRGMLLDDQDPSGVKQRGLVIQTNPSAPLASWSTSRKAVQDFMFGWERPWALIALPATELDIVIDLAVFERQAKPFQHMREQKEVIVKMPASLVVAASQLRISLW